MKPNVAVASFVTVLSQSLPLATVVQLRCYISFNFENSRKIASGVIGARANAVLECCCGTEQEPKGYLASLVSSVFTESGYS